MAIAAHANSRLGNVGVYYRIVMVPGGYFRKGMTLRNEYSIF